MSTPQPDRSNGAKYLATSEGRRTTTQVSKVQPVVMLCRLTKYDALRVRSLEEWMAAAD